MVTENTLHKIATVEINNKIKIFKAGAHFLAVSLTYSEKVFSNGRLQESSEWEWF